MTHEKLIHDLEQALAEVPMLDVHTHLIGGKLGAQGLHDILLYHMVISDLYAAGCPSGVLGRNIRTGRSLHFSHQGNHERPSKIVNSG